MTYDIEFERASSIESETDLDRLSQNRLNNLLYGSFDDTDLDFDMQVLTYFDLD